MAMFALAMIPLIYKLVEVCKSIYQIWFADNATAASTANCLRQWWDTLSSRGPCFGYYPNPSKTVLMVGEEYVEKAKIAFRGTGITISTHGSRHLGAALGSLHFIEECVDTKVKGWIEEIKNLAAIADTQPQAVYAAFFHGTKNKWTYLCRTISGISHLLQPLEDAIQQKLIPSIYTGQPPCSQLERDLLSLPVKMGGMGLTNPTAVAEFEFETSKEISAPPIDQIIHQDLFFKEDPTISRRNEVKTKKGKQQSDMANNIYHHLPIPQHRLMDCAGESGASSWLSALAVEEHHFSLSKGAFRDALGLRYG